MEKLISKTPSIEEYGSIKAKMFALHHPIRFEIMRMLKLKEKKNSGDYHYIENYSMNTHEINDKLKNEHNIVIAIQMLGQHLKILRL